MELLDTKPRGLCPSSTCSPGAILLGVVQSNGTVAFLEQQRILDEFFVKLANEGRQPEKRFRFADPCVKSGCMQWGNGRCGVIDKVLAANPDYRNGEPLPTCSIRTDCRWHMQWGARACGICPLIITDIRQDAPP
jgi:hypothetical protein